MQLKAPVAKQGEQLCQQHPPAIAPRQRSWIFHTRGKGNYPNYRYLLRASCYMQVERGTATAEFRFSCTALGSNSCLVLRSPGVPLAPRGCRRTRSATTTAGAAVAQPCPAAAPAGGFGKGMLPPRLAVMAAQNGHCEHCSATPTSITWKKHPFSPS